MKKGGAMLLCVLLLVTLALPVRAEGQGLLYPGVSIQGDYVYLLGVSTTGGTVQATANGQAVSCTSSALQETSIGITYYCVVSVTSSLSDVQREQQRSGVIAISQALGPNDGIVLVTMGREVTFGDRLTASDDISAAIDQACDYSTFGTNLYESIDTVLTTVSQAEGFSSVVFFTDGCDHSNVVKYTSDQIARIIQNSGLCVSFLALLTPPVSSFAAGRAELMQQYAEASAGGVYHAPLREDSINYITVMENAGREIVTQSANWTVYQFNAADLPRDSKTIELALTWTDGATSLEGSAQVTTASLPALPEPTQPETEPETEPTETLPPPTEATEPVPEFQPDNESKTLYYAALGGVALLILALFILLISTLRRAARRKKRKNKRPTPAPDASANRTFVPAMPKEAEEVPASAEPEAIAEAPVPEEPEAIEEVLVPEEPIKAEEIPVPAEPEAVEETPVPEEPEVAEEVPVPEEPEKVEDAPVPTEPEAIEETPVPEELVKSEEAPVPVEPEAVEEVPAPVEPEAAEEAPVPVEPEKAEGAPVPVEPEKVEEAPIPEKSREVADEFSLEALLQSIQGSDSEASPAAEEPAESAEEGFSLEALYRLLGEPVPEKAEPEKPKVETPPVKPEKPKAATPPVRPEEPKKKPAPVQPEKPKKQAAPAAPKKEEVPDLDEFPVEQNSKGWHSLFRRKERWIDDVNRPEKPVSVEPPPKAPTHVPSCTVRLMPEGNPGGSVYVTMEPHSSRTLGRNQKADIILNSSDTCLSGLHFELQWDGRVLYLTDRNSTNGTAITGVRQRPGRWARVETGATIQAGNTRYKVRIMRK